MDLRKLNKEVEEFTYKVRYEGVPVARALVRANEAVEASYENEDLNDLDVATSLMNLALIYLIQDRDAAAEPLFRRALMIYEEALGPNHILVAKSLNNLARSHIGQNEFAEAEMLCQRALAIYDSAGSTDQPDVSEVILHLGMNLHGKNELTKALEGDDPDLGIILNHLGALCYAQERYQSAELYFKRMVSIWEQSFGPDHYCVSVGLSCQAELYRTMSREEEAVVLEERAENIRSNHLVSP